MLYEYQCQNCALEFEFDQKITDKPKKKCPSCKKMTLQRLIGSTSFRLVGTGWFGSGGY